MTHEAGPYMVERHLYSHFPGFHRLVETFLVVSSLPFALTVLLIYILPMLVPEKAEESDPKRS